MGDWAAWHQRSSWAQPRAQIQSSGCHAVFRFSSAKTMISADKHRGFADLSCFSGLSTCSSRSLSRGGFSDRLFTLSADRYLAKIMLGCHVSFKRIFQNRCQNHRVPLQFTAVLKTPINRWKKLWNLKWEENSLSPGNLPLLVRHAKQFPRKNLEIITCKFFRKHFFVLAPNMYFKIRPCYPCFAKRLGYQ